MTFVMPDQDHLPRIRAGDGAVSDLALERLMKGHTLSLVAHRLTTIRHAQRIVVIEQGRIVEVGDHATLLQQQGLYALLQA